MAGRSEINRLIVSACDLSVGISVVVAVLLGFFVGHVLHRITGVCLFTFVGLLYGLLGAVLNVYKSYKRLYDEFRCLASSGRCGQR